MKVNVTKDLVIITEYSPVNSGEKGLNICEFQLPEEFSGLTVTAAFNNIPVPVCDGECVIPTLKKGTAILGVYAYKESDAGVELMYSPKPTAFYVNEGSYTEEVAIEEIPSITEYEKYCQMFTAELMKKVENREDVANKTQVITENSTHDQYPSAKGVYDLVKSEKENGIKDKVFERIAAYTVTPDSDGSLPTKITINKDDDGNPFELTDVYCDVLIGLTDGLTGRFYVSVGNPSERNMISVIGNATLNINNTQLRKWCFRVDNYGDGRGGLTSAPSISLMHTADFPSANVSAMYGQPIPVWRTIDIREVQFVGQAGNTQTFMEGTTITLWGVRKQ